MWKIKAKAAKDGLERWPHVFGVDKDFLSRTQKTLIMRNNSSPRREKRLVLTGVRYLQISNKALHLDTPKMLPNLSTATNKSRQPMLKHGQ